MDKVRQIRHDVMKFLAGFDTLDYPSVEHVAEAVGYPPKVLLSIPEVRSLFEPKGIEAYLDWKLSDWLEYHYHVVHQGYRYGAPELQQTWRGVPIIKNPLDCWVYQEIICRTQPDILLELGVAFGGSGLYFADLMESLGRGLVLGVDIDVSRAAGVEHPRIERLEGSSVGDDMVAEVWARCEGKRVMVIADSDHRESHVMAELEAYSGLVGEGMYFIVEDTLADVMKQMPVPVGGPLPAVHRFLAAHGEFELDMTLSEKYLLTQSPYGFLRRKSS